MRHRCGAYCAPPEHCDLAYAPARYSAKQVGAALWWGDPPLWVTRVEAAREAPPLAAVPLPMRDHHGLRPVEPNEPHRAWLVWWLSAREARARGYPAADVAVSG